MTKMIARANPRKLRVLVVDDDRHVRRALSRTLAREHEVVEAEGGRAALALLRCGERFDAIFCDVTMPGMSGIELFAALTEGWPDQATRMIALTGGVSDADELDACFGDRQLMKPARSAELFDAICAVTRLAEVA